MLTKTHLCWFCVVFSLSFISCQKYIDDPCTHTDSGKNGRCVLFENCPSAIQDLQKSKFPQTCGFQGTQPIVCCVKETSSTAAAVTTTTTTAATTMKKPNIQGRIGEKSKQKCKEYGKYVFKKERPPVLLIGVDEIETDECGFVEVPLIVGGVAAKAKEFPHMAAVGFGSPPEISWDCGGTLISERFVLTAGHCLYHRVIGTAAKYVRIGDLNIKNKSDDEKLQQFNVQQIIKYPEYTVTSRYNDIALLKLDKAAKLNPFVRPACLHTESEIPTQRAIATGWGRTQYSGSQSDVLLKVTLELFTAESCNHTFRRESGSGRLEHGIDYNTQVCAGSHTEEKDTCQMTTCFTHHVLSQVANGTGLIFRKSKRRFV